LAVSIYFHYQDRHALVTQFLDISVLRAQFTIMEEIHGRHNIELDGITQDDDDTFTQGTAASRSTIFTNVTSNTCVITQKDIEAFQRALEIKNSDLCDDLDNRKKLHRTDDDSMHKEILELHRKKNAMDNGEL
jgi:hypothetical protein